MVFSRHLYAELSSTKEIPNFDISDWNLPKKGAMGYKANELGMKLVSTDFFCYRRLVLDHFLLLDPRLGASVRESDNQKSRRRKRQSGKRLLGQVRRSFAHIGILRGNK